VVILQIVGLLFAGVLAGEEFIVRYGVQPSLSTMDDRPHLLARQALVRRMRYVVPALMIPTVLLGLAVAIAGGTGVGCVFRWIGFAALVAFVLFSFLGTVPINIKVNDWNPDAPPADWKAVVKRWQFIDVFRSSAALLAFVCFLIAVARELSAAGIH
jgi:uncharacterized membrane protein